MYTFQNCSTASFIVTFCVSAIYNKKCSKANFNQHCIYESLKELISYAFYCIVANFYFGFERLHVKQIWEIVRYLNFEEADEIYLHRIKHSYLLEVWKKFLILNLELNGNTALVQPYCSLNAIVEIELKYTFYMIKCSELWFNNSLFVNLISLEWNG